MNGLELITEINSNDRDHIFIATKPDLYDKHLALYQIGLEVKIQGICESNNFMT
jgi:hypothetical protein